MGNLNFPAFFDKIRSDDEKSAGKIKVSITISYFICALGLFGQQMEVLNSVHMWFVPLDFKKAKQSLSTYSTNDAKGLLEIEDEVQCTYTTSRGKKQTRFLAQKKSHLTLRAKRAIFTFFQFLD